jgi:hypothetical protein
VPHSVSQLNLPPYNPGTLSPDETRTVYLQGGGPVSRIFVGHSSKHKRQAQALRAWLVAQDPPLANEIFLDTDPDAGLKPGVKWKNELVSANSRCEAVICLLSNHWESSAECLAEYRTAENLGKQILCARLQDGTGRHTSEWQHTDLFTDGLPGGGDDGSAMTA